MGIGKIDPEYAIREGWARDSDDEIYMDGYNAFIQISTRDGTSGFSVKNDIGAVYFSAKSDGDGYVAKNLGVGTNNPSAALEVVGKIKAEQLQIPNGALEGRVLTSDSCGNATWQDVSGPGLITFSEKFSGYGNSSNYWMQIAYGCYSNQVFFVSPWDCKITALTFSNVNCGVDVGVELYKSDRNDGDNKYKIYTWGLDNVRIAYKSGLNIVFNAGDKLSVYLKDKGKNPSFPVVTIYFKVNDDALDENDEEDIC